jgi:hypothetical protein
MLSSYRDILSRIVEEPKWWDQNGVPRYDKFEPRLCPSIYTHQVVLLEIACQDCGGTFEVEMHAGVWEERGFIPKQLHYGDPPRHDCVGDTMNCEDLEVLEAWGKDGMGDWVRHPELEGRIE